MARGHLILFLLIYLTERTPCSPQILCTLKSAASPGSSSILPNPRPKYCNACSIALHFFLCNLIFESLLFESLETSLTILHLFIIHFNIYAYLHASSTPQSFIDSTCLITLSPSLLVFYSLTTSIIPSLFPFMPHSSDNFHLFLFLSLFLAEMLACLYFHPLFSYDFAFLLSTLLHQILSPSFSPLFFQFITFFDYPLLSSPFNTFISWFSLLIFHPFSPHLLVVFLLSSFKSAPLCVSSSFYLSISRTLSNAVFKSADLTAKAAHSARLSLSLFFDNIPSLLMDHTGNAFIT